VRILVTGPTGAIGQYVLEGLMQTDHDVRVLSLPDSLHRINFRDRIEIVMGELSDDISLAEAVAGVDIIYHCALVGPPPAMSADHMNHVNVAGTRNLLRHAAGRVSRVVLCSSNNVYTPHRAPAMWPLLDDALREAHGNPQQIALGESLIAAEDAVFEAHARDDQDYAILRPTVVAGRKCPFVEQMIISILKQPGTIEVQRRMWDTMQWAHGSDIAAATLLVGEHPDAANQCFLVAGNEPITIYDVQAHIWDIMNVGKDDNPHRDIAERNNLGLCKFEPRKLRALGWAPRVDVRSCITEVLGRLEFYSSAGIKLPAHMLGD
jgi:nucleoside-diphosphate-sugar epimerase